MVGRISVKIGLAIGPFLESCLLSERTDRQMSATTIESVSGLDIRFSKEELLSMRAEIDGELKRREKAAVLTMWHKVRIPVRKDDGRKQAESYESVSARDAFHIGFAGLGHFVPFQGRPENSPVLEIQAFGCVQLIPPKGRIIGQNLD